jgi:molybdenum cofactor cytidylyltransferase
MGRNKLLLPWRGTTVLGAVVSSLAEAGIEDIAVVVGSDAGSVEKAVEPLPCRTVFNERHAEGIGTSIAAGVASCPADAVGFLIVPGDMPLIPPSLIERILHCAGPEALAVPRAGERWGQPVFFGRRFRAELSALSGDVGARPVVERHVGLITFLDVDDPSPFEDVDSAEDLERLLSSTKKEGSDRPPSLP